ncbi:MAG: hypothetical protein A2677_04040 [Candidatus Komeilibacteria bacterium RIFCSPHIGHO2_01_FULL_52_14]|nr:MAG: hypothetical protein A2677_04040 [Candidatus Komeilibacteria bacterium RIFCSPHIGHO2_01_FULL_52_14]
MFPADFEKRVGGRNARLVYGIGIACGIVVVIALLYVFFGGKSVSVPFLKRQETPEQKADRLSLMNILNRFTISEAVSGSSATSTPSVATARRQHIQQTVTELENLDTDGELRSIQQKLIQYFHDWDAALAIGGNTGVIRKGFLALGDQYSWLSTLSWLIVLNRL